VSAESKCTRCGADVTTVLDTKSRPLDRDTWRRYRALMVVRHHKVTHVLRFRMFTLRWLPADPHDQLRETYTELHLCDDCATAVFLFAQGKAQP
jgi:hypothetical protein